MVHTHLLRVDGSISASSLACGDTVGDVIGDTVGVVRRDRVGVGGGESAAAGRAGRFGCRIQYVKPCAHAPPSATQLCCVCLLHPLACACYFPWPIFFYGSHIWQEFCPQGTAMTIVFLALTLGGAVLCPCFSVDVPECLMTSQSHFMTPFSDRRPHGSPVAHGTRAKLWSSAEASTHLTAVLPEAHAAQHGCAEQRSRLAGNVQRQRLGQHSQVLPHMCHEADVSVAPLWESCPPLRLHLPHKYLRRRLQLQRPHTLLLMLLSNAFPPGGKVFVQVSCMGEAQSGHARLSWLDIAR